MTTKTTVTISRDDFYINGQPTYLGRSFRDWRVEGLLMNSRMVQGIFDDLNPETVSQWDWEDESGKWDAGANTNRFIAAMPSWREHGLVAFTMNLQGGNPQGYGKHQPWHNSAFDHDGTLRRAFMARLERICDEADRLGMAVILSYFYFGQDQRLDGEQAVIQAVDNATDWVLERGYQNVLIEIGNEVNLAGPHHFTHEIITAPRCHELIDRVRQRSGGKLLISTSFSGGAVPTANIVEASDFLLLHGNGVQEPQRIAEMVQQTRAMAAYRGQPIVFNEDDHFDFDEARAGGMNNMLAAVSEHAGWGFFDYRFPGEGFEQGYQSVPTDWGINSERKRGFFGLLNDIAGE